MIRQLNRLFWRSGLWVCLLLLLMLTLYVSAGRILTPMLNAYRIEVQDWLGGQLGQPLHLGRLHAGWHGVSPRFYAEDVRLGDGEQPLHIERLHFRPDMLSSLWHGDWTLAAISLQGLDIELQQQADSWLLNGMVLQGAADGASTDWTQLLGRAGRIGHLSLVDARVRIRLPDTPPFELQQAGITLEQQGSSRHLQASVVLPDGQQLQVAAHARGDVADWQQGSLDAYLSVPGSNWLQWLPPAWQQLLPAGMELDSAALSLQAWLGIEQGQLRSLVLDSDGGQVRGRWQERELDLELGRVRASMTADAGGRLLWLPDLNVRWSPQVPMQSLALQARQQGTGPLLETSTEITIGHLQLEPLMTAVLQYVPMPGLAHDILAQLDFRGRLTNTRLRWTPGVHWQQQLEYDTNLQGLDYSPWKHVPGATGISGRLFGSLAGGELHLDSSGFSLYLRELFADPWQYHQARARLTWSLAQNFDFRLTSPYLQVQGDEGSLAGDFDIWLPAADEEESYMDLRVGMRDGNAAYKARYLPLVLRDEQPQLWGWLHDAILGADVHQGYFQYQGSLEAGAPPGARSISLYFDVSKAELAYQPGWPVLEDGRAQVYVHDQGVEIEIERARILQTEISNAHAEVAYHAAGASTLGIQARLDGSMADALQVVQQTPLAQQLPVMAGWQGQGGLAGDLQLEIPFADSQTMQVLLDMQLDNNSLYMPDLDVRLEQLQGELVIDSLKGMTSNGVLGRFLGQPFTASMRPQPASREWSSQIRARGSMPVKRLQDWLGHAQPLPFAGAFEYQLDLSLAGQGSQLAINTDLQGVAIDLPAPLAKTATEKVPTSWHMTLDGSELHYRLVHGSRVNGLFAVAQTGERAVRGQLMLGGSPARLPAGNGLWIAGQLTQLPLPDWLAAVERYNPAPGGGEDAGLQEIRLDIARLEGFGIPLEQAQLNVRPDTAGWLATLASKQARGAVRIPASGALLVDLDWLQLPQDAGENLLQEAGGLTPADVPAIQASIRQLALGDEVLGTLAFASVPDDAGGVRFDDLTANLKGLQLEGSLHWYGQPGQRSSFRGQLTGGQLEQVLQDWGYEPSMSSESFTAGLELDWPGAPQEFAVASLDGVVQLKLRKGQLKAADGSAQVLRVFGLLNFDAIGRRLRLDFTDLWGKGLSYDRIDGVIDIERGVFSTREALTLEGISSNLTINGSLDVPAGSIKADMQVAMPISRNLPLAAVAVGAPAVGGALFVIDRLVGDRFARMAAVRYTISGDWQDPQITLSKGSNDK